MKGQQHKQSLPDFPHSRGCNWNIDATRGSLAPRRLLPCHHERDSLTADTAAVAAAKQQQQSVLVYTVEYIYRRSLFFWWIRTRLRDSSSQSHLTPWRSLPPPCLTQNGPKACLVSLLQCVSSGVCRCERVQLANSPETKNSTEFVRADPPNQNQRKNAVDVGPK